MYQLLFLLPSFSYWWWGVSVSFFCFPLIAFSLVVVWPYHLLGNKDDVWPWKWKVNHSFLICSCTTGMLRQQWPWWVLVGCLAELSCCWIWWGHSPADPQPTYISPGQMSCRCLRASHFPNTEDFGRTKTGSYSSNTLHIACGIWEFSPWSLGRRAGSQDPGRAADVPMFFLLHLYICASLHVFETRAVHRAVLTPCLPSCEKIKGQPWVLGAVDLLLVLLSWTEDGAEFPGCRVCVVLAATGWSTSKRWACPQCL